MLQIITRHNAHLFEDQLDQMHRLRHRVLVEQKGWEDLRREDGREVDQFDNAQTTYVVVLDDNAHVVGSCRMQPSLVPTLTSEVFPHLCNFNGVPRSDKYYDCSRFLADPTLSQKSQNPSWVATELYLGMVEFGLALGLEGLTCVLSVDGLHFMKRWHWDVDALGLPHEVEGTPSVAAVIRTTNDMLEMFHRTRNVDAPVIDRAMIGLIRCNHQLIHDHTLPEAA